MAMSTGNNDGGLTSEINITPLADVMLVLLIIFMITAPLASHKIKVDLPKAQTDETKAKSTVPPIDLAVQADGSMFWNDREVNEAELKAKLAVAAQQSPQPELQIRGDKTTRYKTVREVLEAAKGSGMVHIGFVTTAPSRSP